MNPFSRKHPGWRTLTLLVLALGLAPLRAADEPPTDDRIFMEDVKVNGKPVHMAFDTGAEDFVLSRLAAERLGLKSTILHPAMFPARAMP